MTTKLLIMLVMGWSMFMQAHEIVYTQHVYCVILAGGNGERLWPLSRSQLPKQLLAVGGERTLLDQAIDRVTGLVPTTNIVISTTEQHAEHIAYVVGDRVGTIMIEPGSRNTGPAILYCCMEIYRHDPEAVVVFLPADPFIPHEVSFAEILTRAINFASTHDEITLLGVKPSYPATGYGYIEYDQCAQAIVNDGLMPVKKFHEKPTYEAAQKYVAAGTMLWNTGMFCAKASIFLEEYEHHAPAMFTAMKEFMQGIGHYEDIASDSIDYAIMEKSTRISVLPVDFPWCDVGNIEVFLSLKKQVAGQHENIMCIDAADNLVDAPGKLVALVGIDNICIVDTGDVLLIVKKNEAEKVKQIVKLLKQMQTHTYL